MLELQGISRENQNVRVENATNFYERLKNSVTPENEIEFDTKV